MDKFGFLKVAAAVPAVRIADCDYNGEQIVEMIRRAASKGVEAVVFPELSTTAYTCGDLLLQPALIAAAERIIVHIAEATKALTTTSIVGAPIAVCGALYNCAVVIAQGEIKAIVPKLHIPNYTEFYESRWFKSGNLIRQATIDYGGQHDIPIGVDLLFTVGGAECCIEICEDLWTPIPPSSMAAVYGAKVIFNLSASPEVAGKHDYLLSLIAQQSARSVAAYVYSSSGAGESSTDLVFAGNGIIAENGNIVATTERFADGGTMAVSDVDINLLQFNRCRCSTFEESAGENRFRRIDIKSGATPQRDLDRKINPAPFVPASDARRDERCEEIYRIQVAGLKQRLAATGCKRVVIGISGGLDSTQALLVSVGAFDALGIDRKAITGVTMPGFGTTDRTYTNALNLMRELGITQREVSIRKACEQHFKDIGLSANDRSTAYENCQARERTQILMDIANIEGGMVIGTGDLSELALGWATYNGDQMSMYGVNASIPKTLIRHLVSWFAERSDNNSIKELLTDIVATPVSPELLPADEQGQIAQKTEDIVGPYELHDFFLYCIIRQGYAPRKILFLAEKAFAERYSHEVIKGWLRTFVRRFFTQQFKRSAMPDGPKVGTVSLSPRGDWRMPSDASASLWLKEIDQM